VSLSVITGDPAIFPTCFRPDVGGEYIAELTLDLGLSRCYQKQTATFTVTCPDSAPDLSSIVNRIEPVSRYKPTRVVLNASSVTDESPHSDLVFNWKILYPKDGDRSPIDGEEYSIPELVNYQSMVSSFLVPQSGVTYVVELSVRDYCHTTVKNFTISTPCEFEMPFPNKTLAASFDGSVPVQLMSFAYDHTLEVAQTLAYPKCQTYLWTLVDYSVAYSDSLFASSEPEFAKTAGFAGLIAAIVIIAVVVPLVLWAYCTKKACFKSTDPRV
jgi:hypothetical protein